MKTIVGFVRKHWLPAILMVFIIILLLCQKSSVSKLKQDKERLSVELAHAQIAPPIAHDTIRDSVPVSTAPVVVMERSTYKSDIAEKQLLRDLGVATGQIESQQTAGSSYTDTVRMTESREAVLHYSDRWTDLTLSMKPPDTTLVYSVRDSVVTFVYREYKHRFLWWKWGTKGYKVKVVNFNPHATIRYNQFVKVE